MMVGFITLYIELAGLMMVSGYIVSSLFVPMIMPASISSEHALLLSMQ
jgi:hypothetical protein